MTATATLEKPAPASISAAPAPQDPSLADLARAMDGRAGTYGLLSRLYRVEVDGSLLAQLRGTTFPLNTGNEHVDRGYELMHRYLSSVWEPALLDLARDYVRVFIGHGVNGHSAAYPYESVHTSEKRLMMQEARAEVLAVYRANNLKKDARWRECEDHIAVELEFMQVMCQRTAALLRAGDEEGAAANLAVQRDFVRDHLANWVPMLVTDMLRFSETELYRGLAELTQGFVQTECELLDELLGVEQAA